MSSTKITGIGMMIRRHNLLNRTRPALFADGQLRGSFASFSDSDEDQRKAMEERAKETMGNVMGVAKDTSDKIKDRVMGSGGKTSHPSQDPEQNHGVEKTDSSCEDVRDRPGGYS